ncbi:hypothetical protein BX600DRAFT_440205 [Xylariales sp. PMI_506]|nr:hypothetical protein BX600DRAFT_440205 [Xylariales sp. PMI_506]
MYMLVSSYFHPTTNPSIAKAGRAIILQEISNTCHLEYRRAQANFKRHVQISSGSKWFKRIAGRYDDIGNARINPKGDLENVIRIDPQLYYMIHLCQQASSASKATDWIKKLSDLHRSFPLDPERITEREIDSFCDLSVIVGFIQDLSKVIKMTTFSQKNGQAFSSKLQKLTAEQRSSRRYLGRRGIDALRAQIHRFSRKRPGSGSWRLSGIPTT